MLKIFVLFTLVSAAVAVNVTACDKDTPVPNFVESDFCSSTKCTFKRGKTFTARAGFTPKGNFTSLSAKLNLKKFGMWFEVELPKDVADVCKSLEAEAKCPVEAGKQYVWALKLLVDSKMASLDDVEVELKVQDKKKKNVGCARLDGFVE